MWPFKRKIVSHKITSSGPPCSQCQSTETRVITHHGTGEEAHIKVWRGQRYVTYRCQNCGNDFYAEECPQIIEIELKNDESIDDPSALQAAEDDLKRQSDAKNDRMFR
jgi:predicted nucleic-acid-binding Zn-ribbon protein